MKEQDNGESPKLGQAKLEDVKLEKTSVLQISKNAAKSLDLRSPDDFASWTDDPDDVRAEKRALRRKAKDAAKKEKSGLNHQ